MKNKERDRGTVRENFEEDKDRERKRYDAKKGENERLVVVGSEVQYNCQGKCYTDTDLYLR